MEKLGRLDKIDRFKVEICGLFVRYLSENKMEQQVLAKKLQLNTALMSKIVRFKFQEFTIDRLLRLLEPIRPDIVPVLKKSSKAIKQKRKKP